MYDPVKGTFDEPDTYRAAQSDANLGFMTDPVDSEWVRLHSG